MRKNPGGLAVLTRHQDISLFIDHVIEAADKNKDALGFYADSVYREFARSEDLYVIVSGLGESAEYVGHVMFSCRFPKAKVLQMYVVPQFRGHGLANRLLDHLKAALTQHGVISIHARVSARNFT